MTINQDVINGKWLEIKGEVQKAWGKLTADEIEKTKGDITSIAGLVLQRYGIEKENFQKRFSEIVESFQAKKENVVTDIKATLRP
jgi:uncharacterized protein YjbJ (UPF0337 family)